VRVAHWWGKRGPRRQAVGGKGPVRPSVRSACASPQRAAAQQAGLRSLLSAPTDHDGPVRSPHQGDGRPPSRVLC